MQLDIIVIFEDLTYCLDV